MKEKRAPAYLTLTFLIFSIFTSPIVFAQEANPETLVITVYPDGFTSVDYKLNTNSTFPTHNITIFGEVPENLIVTDSNGLPLGYALNDTVLSVYTLGTNEITITYHTHDLTSKQGRYWAITLDAPINARIILPEETVIISLNKVPEIIETNDDKVTLLMEDGLIQVVYILGVVGTKEYAQLVIDEAEQTISEIQSFGINVTETEIKLQQAEEAFSLGNYAEAEKLGDEAKNMAVEINQKAVHAQNRITESEAAIIKAQNEGRIVGLNDAQNLLEQAQNAYNIGNYLEALNLATQALTIAEEAQNSLSEENEAFPFFQLFAALLAAPLLVFAFLFIRLRKKSKAKKIRKIDAARIFKENKELMPDEKQAIQFLIDNNGEAFEAELYDHVKLPRTTTWRMVKRLKRMDIITVTKFRRQNLVRLKTKFDLKE